MHLSTLKDKSSEIVTDIREPIELLQHSLQHESWIETDFSKSTWRSPTLFLPLVVYLYLLQS